MLIPPLGWLSTDLHTSRPRRGAPPASYALPIRKPFSRGELVPAVITFLASFHTGATYSARPLSITQRSDDLPAEAQESRHDPNRNLLSVGDLRLQSPF